MNLYVREGATRRYRVASPDDISLAAAHHAAQAVIGQTITSPEDTMAFPRSALAGRSYEAFCCVFLDNRHRVRAFEELFRGTIDSATVYPREVVRQALQRNAAALILAHNHPSGVPEPSEADRLITRRLKDAAELLGIRILDHIVVGREGQVSVTSRGLL